MALEFLEEEIGELTEEEQELLKQLNREKLGIDNAIVEHNQKMQAFWKKIKEAHTIYGECGVRNGKLYNWKVVDTPKEVMARLTSANNRAT